jgi:hypothetical protein
LPCNHFRCPLPPHSDQCQIFPGIGGQGVHCRKNTGTVAEIP